MTFQEYYEKAVELCIVDNGDTWSSYVNPAYLYILQKNELLPAYIEDAAMNISDVLDMLKLEVEMRHALTDKRKILAERLFDLIESEIDPAEEAKRSELINGMIEYLKTKDAIEQKARELNEREEQIDKKETAKAVLPSTINFAKRGSTN